MATSFHPSEYVCALRHLDSMSLLSHRDALRDAKLTIEEPREFDDGETTLIGAGTIRLIPVIDTTRVKSGVYATMGSVEQAMDQHIAVNILLTERGFTEAIDNNPELTIVMPR